MLGPARCYAIRRSLLWVVEEWVMADIRKWAEALAERLKAELDTEEDGTYTVLLAAEDDYEFPITLYAEELDDGPADGRTVVLLRAAAGDLEDSDDSDLAGLLRVSAHTWFARLYLEEETDSFVVEAALPFDGLTEDLLEQAAHEVIELAMAADDVLDDDDADEGGFSFSFGDDADDNGNDGPDDDDDDDNGGGRPPLRAV